MNGAVTGAAGLALAVSGCASPANDAAVLDDGANHPPVAINAESPVRYPLQLFEEKIEGTVVLQLFVDEAGAAIPDSTRVVEPSGYPALDSAAIASVPDLRFSPGLRDGRPQAMTFLQPIHFRHPEGTGPGNP